MISVFLFSDFCFSVFGFLFIVPSEYSLSEIVERNGRGECWLIIDCMVLDVTTWLPEHPGGNSIIPEQVVGGGGDGVGAGKGGGVVRVQVVRVGVVRVVVIWSGLVWLGLLVIELSCGSDVSRSGTRMMRVIVVSIVGS